MNQRQTNIVSAVIGVGVGGYLVSLMFLPDDFSTALRGGEVREGLIVAWIAVVLVTFVCGIYLWRNKKVHNEILNGGTAGGNVKFDTLLPPAAVKATMDDPAIKHVYTGTFVVEDGIVWKN